MSYICLNCIINDKASIKKLNTLLKIKEINVCHISTLMVQSRLRIWTKIGRPTKDQDIERMSYINLKGTFKVEDLTEKN